MNKGERSRKIQTLILQRLAEKGQVEVAKDISTSESTISRFKDNLEMLGNICESLGVKVVPEEMQCFDPDYIQSLRTIAKHELIKDSTPKLSWD